MDSSETLDSEDSQINLLILGSGGFAQAMESEIRVCKGVEEKIKILQRFGGKLCRVQGQLCRIVQCFCGETGI